MASPAELDKVILYTKDGNQFPLWSQVTVRDDFLSPCQTVSLTVDADETRFAYTKTIRPGQQFVIEVNGNPAIGGFIDSVEVTGDRGGTFVEVTGRDVLSPVVDSHVNPRMAIRKTMSLEDLAQALFLDEFNLPIAIFLDPDPPRAKAMGKAVSTKPKKGKHKTKDPLKEVRPHDNEGAFQYFIRFAHRVGYHAWADPDGSGIIIAAPTYDQQPAYQLVRRVSTTTGQGAANNIEKGTLLSDNTSVPTDVYVRGKSTKAGEKAKYLGYAHRDGPIFKPFYLGDDESDSKEHCDTVARFTLSKALKSSFVYTCTVRGLSDPSSGRVYTVDSVVDLDDEVCGVKGLMWVEGRTLRKSRSGTFTDLRLIPADSLTMDYYASDSPPPAPPAGGYKAVNKPTRKALDPCDFETRNAATWFAGGTPPKRT